MDIEKELLHEHSKENSIFIGNYIIANPTRLSHLLKVFLGSDEMLSKRSGMVVSYVHDSNPEIFKKTHNSQIIKDFIEKKQNVAVKRNSVRIIQNMKVPEEFHSSLFNRCLELMLSEEETIAVRVFSMQVIYNLCRIYKDLKAEVIISLEDILNLNSSGGIQNRGKKILKALYNL